MHIMNDLLKNAQIFLLKVSTRFPFLMSDEQFLKMKFKIKMGKSLNIIKPVTFNEKLQWLKLYDRRPEYTQMVDKEGVKKYVANIIGGEHIITTLGVWDNFNDINFDKLPNQFVLKTTHGCGGIIICKDKLTLKIYEAKKEISRSLKRNYFVYGREWPYKNVKRRIIAEELMVDESGVQLKDYKFFCFNGEPKALFIATDRPFDTRFDFYDIQFNHLPFTNGHENSIKPVLKPLNFDKMIELAKKLSQNIPHVRVDLYNINGKIYFGEMTFSHWGGMIPFNPEKWDYIFGSWIKLPQLNNREINFN
jgi:hypothetical protein